jgi:long-chain acyl-CoA synthetase
MTCKTEIYPGDEAVFLGEILLNAAKTLPEKPFLIYQGNEWTFSEVLSHSLAFTKFLQKRNICRNEKVAIVLDNRPEFFFTFFGILYAGCTVVTISPKSSPNRICEIINHSDSVFAVIDGYLHAKIREDLSEKIGQPERIIKLSEIDFSDCAGLSAASLLHSDEFALFQYTSATTGSSKGVMISHSAVLTNLHALAEKIKIKKEHDILSSFMPLYHDMGLVGFGLMPLYCGISLILYSQDIRSIFNWLSDMGTMRPTISGVSNTILYLTHRVISDPSRFDLSSLRILIVGSEPVYVQTVKGFERDYRVTSRVVPAYGLAEATLCVTMSEIGIPLKCDAANVVSCGRPLPGVEIRLETGSGGVTGEILVKSPSLMSGYYKNKLATEETFTDDGYLRTGDIGYIDDDGDLFIIGRKKNVIIRNGENIFPSDLEAISLKDQNVRVAAVFGVPSKIRENYEEIVLVLEVVSKKTLSNRELLARIREKILSSAKESCSYLPDQFIFVAPGAIPFSPNGKLQHLLLQKRFISGEIKNSDRVESVGLF